jgi:hypothetical protein
MPHDENHEDIKEVHGIKIDHDGHEDALHFLEKHVSKEQLKEMAHNAKHSLDGDHNSHFKARINGVDYRYKLEHHSSGFKIAKVRH